MTNKKTSEQTPEWNAAFIVAQFLKHGFSLSSPQGVDFHLYFPDREGATAAGEKLRSQEFTTDVRPFPGEGKWKWFCIARLMLIPEETRLVEIIRQLQTLANILKGEYGGWEIEVPASSSIRHFD